MPCNENSIETPLFKSNGEQLIIVIFHVSQVQIVVFAVVLVVVVIINYYYLIIVVHSTCVVIRGSRIAFYVLAIFCFGVFLCVCLITCAKNPSAE